MALSKIPNYLQDLIDSDAIGSSAVTSAKIGSLPSGTSIQTITVPQNTFTSVSSTSYSDIFPDLSITMKGNNKVVVMAFLQGISTSTSAARATFKIKIDGTLSAELARDAFYSVGDIRTGIALSWVSGNYTAGQTITFNISYANVVDDGSTIYVNRPYTGANISNLVVQEIAG